MSILHASTHQSARLAMATCLLLLSRAPAMAGPPAEIGAARQLLLVTSASWGATSGTLQRYERDRVKGPFRPVGPPLQVVLGRSGMGWRNDEEAPPPPVLGPQKREGDGRSPAGVLELGELWGYGPSAPAGSRLPYHQAGDKDRCVDDAASPDYGQLLPEPASGPPWRSAEVMRRKDDLYRHLIVVRYNMAHPRKGAGSCIFLHLYDGPTSTTAGCTAMSEQSMLLLLRWLDPAQHPVLVQLPTSALEAARKAWQVP